MLADLRTFLVLVSENLAAIAAITGLLAILVAPLVQLYVGVRQARGAAVSGQIFASTRLLQTDIANLVHALVPPDADEVNRSCAMHAFLNAKFQLDPDDSTEARLVTLLDSFLLFALGNPCDASELAKRIDELRRAFKAVEKSRKARMLG